MASILSQFEIISIGNSLIERKQGTV